MSSLESLPTEILSQIFQNCNTVSDVVSVASTCRNIQSVWLSESKIILWKVGSKEILGFQHAVIAVRAISLVEKAHEQGVLPPVISLSDLATQRPKLGEWKKVFDLRHLVRCFERLFLLPTGMHICFCRRLTGAPPFEPLYWQRWTENFHIATYRALILGAVLSRDYQAPFFSSEKPEGFLEQFTRDLDEGISPDPLSPEEVQYLCKFPVYNLEAYDSMGPAFDTVTRWLLEDCKSQIIARDIADLEASNHSEGPLFREIARTMVMYSHLFSGSSRAYFPHYRFLDSPLFVEFEYMGFSGPTRTVHMVRMGDFQMCEVKTGASVQTMDTSLPLVRRLPASLGPKMPALSHVLEILYASSGRPNHRFSGSGFGFCPGPSLAIFEYIFRNQFNLVFRSDAFEKFDVVPSWDRFIQDGNVFGDVSETACPVTSALPPPVLSYFRIDL